MLKLAPAAQYSQGRSRNWSGAKLINCFPEMADFDKRDQLAVMATPGLTQWASVGLGPMRGSIVMDGVLYVVSGEQFYSVSSSGTGTLLGSVPGSGPCRLAHNGAEIAIVSGTVGYVYSGGVVTTPLAYLVSDVGYVDGYILWTVNDSDQFFISALDDALVYDAADIAVAEGSPDILKGLMVDHRDVLLPGTDSIEIYYNSGNADFPFERQGNAFIERGCFDRDSLVKMDNSTFFMGDDRIVYRLDGYQPIRISTHDMEYQFRNVTYARGFNYTQEGHKFYCLRTDNGTFCFDVSTGRWHQRQSLDLTNWRANGAVTAYSKLLFLSDSDGKIWEASLDVFTESGSAILVDIYLPTIEAARNRQTMYGFEVLCETGVGNSSVTDPQVMLRYSDDNGHLWSNEMWRSLGEVGEYRTRAIWRKLGQFRQRQMHIRIADACRKLVISYFADIR